MRRRMLMLGALLSIGGAAMAAAGPASAANRSASAAAAQRPAVTTGDATTVGQTTARLTAKVDPNGQPTTFYFEYGPTKAYGLQTPTTPAPAGQQPHAVSTPVSGLTPLTRYYFRVVATSGAGTTRGNPHTFVTLKAPLALAVRAFPDPIDFGDTLTIDGTLSGTNAAGKSATVQFNPFPFTGGFKPYGGAQLTNASGAVRFFVAPFSKATQFRLRVGPITSPIETVQVRPRISLQIRRVRGGRVRVFGTVRPGDASGLISIHRRRSDGRYTLVKRISLTAGDPAASFSTRMRFRHRRMLRAVLRSGGGALLTARSRSKRML